MAGEVQRVHQSRSGHLYLELVEKGQDDEVVGKLDAVIWKGDWLRVRGQLTEAELQLAPGLTLRCYGGLDFYPAGGRLQLVVRRLDPVFTLGELERRRRQTLRALAEAGLLERNRRLEFAAAPLDVALVSSEGSAAYQDFVTTLRESGLAFRVHFLHSAVQGTAAERQLVAALHTAARLRVDCVALIRGGGARSDLAVFDSRAVAEAVAQMPVPVLTGLGHETDLSIADRVAHTAVKTPTAVAELLVERVERCELEIEERWTRLVAIASDRLERARNRQAHAIETLRSAATRLTREGERLERLAAGLSRAARLRLFAERSRTRGLAARLGRSACRGVAGGHRQVGRAGGEIVRAARGHLRSSRARLDGWASLIERLGPERTLGRGFSITRRADGALLRSVSAVERREVVITRLTDGEFRSRVEEV